MTAAKKKVAENHYDRAGFEAWAKSEQYDIGTCKPNSGWGRPGEYKENTTKAAWDAWRAAKGYVAPKIVVDISKLKIVVEHEEEGDGKWQNDIFNIYFNGARFAYGNFFLDYENDEGSIPFNWSMYSTTDEVAEQIAKAINFSGLVSAKTPKQAVSLITKQMKAWVKTPQAKTVLEHFFQWNETGTFATRLKSL